MDTTAARPAPGSGTDGVPADSAGDGAVTAAPGRRPRDMILSLVVLLLPIALLAGIYRGLHQGDQPVVIDPAPTVAQARDAGFPVAEPAGLGDGWQPASAVFRAEPGGMTLRLGYLTPSGAGVQVVQSTVPVAQLLPDELDTAAPAAATVDVAGAAWQRFEAGRLGLALVLLEPERTILVVGNAPEPELRTLAAAVAPAG